jgi:hypothetical protein
VTDGFTTGLEWLEDCDATKGCVARPENTAIVNVRLILPGARCFQA